MDNPFPRKALTTILVLFIAVVFIQSLFFKFTDSPETQHIFGTLDAWGSSLGFPGLFARNGIFSPHVVGSVESLASVVLLIALLRKRSSGVALGALLSLGVISGAIFFHLLTPLGIEVLNAVGSRDGGQLFAMACGIWVSSVVLIASHRQALARLMARSCARGTA
ncbi:hypothetical protein [Hydrogenophaga sp. PAMC20947]|uniref:hypothetical protein n=1 Tax=Hydrogenophaga sp. PAMC20947 TaxID=2565558 RepID=UPI00109DB492|nr:hypothetical protein [Hydrogenophaga sp. PAMC20947]QCB45618.1 hypothetical protein E5678_06020 [Hydrogenophaga sp. PAMC20947]